MSNEKIWDRQKKALRDPREIWTCNESSACIETVSLKHRADKQFIELLANLSITLFISREYENLLISLYSDGVRLHQSYMPMPHPSGIVCDRKKELMYVASTRNPNIVIQMRPGNEGKPERPRHSSLGDRPMLVARKKYYPGMYYFHDLALISDKIYGNAVGLNGIVEINLDSPVPDEIVWHPKCVDDSRGMPRTEANYIQLNSIAGGGSLENSFFSASGDKIGNRRPGHLNYPVDKRGVIISGKTRETIGRGLTRPHSARLNEGKLWVANSGYGEFGYLNSGVFEPIIKLKGWTRGVCVVNNIAFVATSRVIPQYRHYAPGLESTGDQCCLYAISLESGLILGKVLWPAGNQVFAIDYFYRSTTNGLVQKRIGEKSHEHTIIAYNHT